MQHCSRVLEPLRRGDSFDTSQAEHFVTAKGLIEFSGSPAIVCTTGLFHCTTQGLLKLLVLGDCRGLSLFNDGQSPFEHQTSIFRGSKVPLGSLPVKPLSSEGEGGGENRAEAPLIGDAITRSKFDGTRAETRFCLSAKRTSPFKSAGCQFSRLLAAEVCGSADSNCIDLNDNHTIFPNAIFDTLAKEQNGHKNPPHY